MQLKKILRFHFTHLKMAKIKNSCNGSYCWGYGARGTLLHYWCECNLVQSLGKSIWQFLRKLEIYLPQDHDISLLGIYPKDAPSYIKDTLSTMFTAALYIKARNWKLDIPQWKNKKKKICGTFTQGNTIQLLKTKTSRNFQGNEWN